MRELKDKSGQITIGVFRDQVSTNASKHELNVTVPDDMIVVGGGGIASPDPGAFLTASRSRDDFQAWTVASTDHTVTDEHKLEGFALGLKIERLDRGQLSQFIRFKRERSGSASHPERVAKLPGFPEEAPSGLQLISGGFEVIPNDDATLGTASYPEFPRTWRAASKDHFERAPAEIEVNAIGIASVLTDGTTPIGRIMVETVSREGGLSDRPEVKQALDPEFALTGIGAFVRWTEPGCMIWKLAPLLENDAGNRVQGVDAAAKDHLEESAATMQAWAIGSQLRLDVCE